MTTTHYFHYVIKTPDRSQSFSPVCPSTIAIQPTSYKGELAAKACQIHCAPSTSDVKITAIRAGNGQGANDCKECFQCSLLCVYRVLLDFNRYLEIGTLSRIALIR